MSDLPSGRARGRKVPRLRLLSLWLGRVASMIAMPQVHERAGQQQQVRQGSKGVRSVVHHEREPHQRHDARGCQVITSDVVGFSPRPS